MGCWCKCDVDEVEEVDDDELVAPHDDSVSGCKPRRLSNSTVFSGFFIIGGGIFFRWFGSGDGRIFSIKCTVGVDEEFERDVRVESLIIVDCINGLLLLLLFWIAWWIGELFDDDEDFVDWCSWRLLSIDFVVGGVTSPLDIGKLSTRSGASVSCICSSCCWWWWWWLLLVDDIERKHCAWHSSTVRIPDRTSRKAVSISIICCSFVDVKRDDDDVDDLECERFVFNCGIGGLDGKTSYIERCEGFGWLEWLVFSYVFSCDSSDSTSSSTISSSSSISESTSTISVSLAASRRRSSTSDKSDDGR